jgi:hypothetical protein
MKLARAGLALLLLALAGSAAHADDWRKEWRTLETQHFHIVYYIYPRAGGERSGEELIAQRLAVIAERVHARMVPVMGPGLSDQRKTWIVLSDDTDDYNGSATVQPYPTVRLNGVTPDDRTEHNDWDDYLTDLFLHEYTHILHLGTIGGWCAEAVNDLLGLGLGIVYPPNQAQPRFLIEGLAVYEESERTSGGRLRSSIWDMYLRMATLENRFQSLAQFTHSPIQFPYANSAYLYGSAFMRYVANRYGERALRLDYEDYGSNCIPAAINRSLKRVTGKGWAELYPEFKLSLKERYGAQRDAIARRGITPTKVLTGPREVVTRPVWTPDGKEILYTDTDGYSRPAIRRMDVATAKWRNEVRTDGAGGPSITRDGRLLVFHAVQPWHTFYYYNDLYLYDRETRTTTRLTEGLRAADPNISPDGRKVVFEVAQNMARGLAMMDLETREITMLIPPEQFEVVYTPVFSPDGKTIAFSWWREGGYRDIWTMDVATHALTRITADRHVDMEPKYSPDGKYLYFVSDRTEVYNLYAYRLADGTLWQASNVVAGLFDPDISPDGKRAAMVGFQANGYHLEVMDLDPEKWWPAAPPLIDRTDEPPVPPAPPLKSHRYNPFWTVIPWTFGFYAQPDGYGEILGVKVGGSDVVGHHAWNVSLGIGTGRSDDVAFSASYSYYGIWPALSMGVGHALTHKSGLVVNGQDVGFDEDDWTFGVSASLPLLRRLIETSDLYLSYSVTYARNLTPVPPPDPSELVPQLPQVGRFAGIGLGWSFSNLRRYTYSVAPEAGRDVGISVGISSKYLGGNTESFSASWHWNEYLGLPWHFPRDAHHVLFVGYSGGIAGGTPGHHTQFFLGGYPQQNLLTSIYDFTRPGTASLRGYPFASVFGDQYHVLNLEYRFPITWIEWGYQTLPLYFRRLHGRFFADYGGAFNGSFSWDQLKLGVGAELILEITYFWFFPAALQFGYAYGVDKGGGNQVYFLLNGPF